MNQIRWINICGSSCYLPSHMLLLELRSNGRPHQLICNEKLVNFSITKLYRCFRNFVLHDPEHWESSSMCLGTGQPCFAFSVQFIGKGWQLAQMANPFVLVTQQSRNSLTRPELHVSLHIGEIPDSVFPFVSADALLEV